MTVEELIRALKSHPGDLRVYVRGYEGGIDDVGRVTEVQVHRNVNDAWYYGSHEAHDPEDPRDGATERGLILRVGEEEDDG